MKKLSLEEARAKIRHYCAYQERCHKEVSNKLFEYGLFKDEVDELIVELITAGFLNEERYARLFAGGKFRMKKWGRLKITRELESKGLTPKCINFGLSEIDKADYENGLTDLLKKKIETTGESDRFIARDKLSKYGIQKGYEPDLVWKIVKELLPEK